MAALIKKLIPKTIKNSFKKLFFGTERFGIHFAQCAEDIQLRSILINFFTDKYGFYIDVGSFHPYIGSNTYSLYQSGWNGINIDPRPGSKNLFDKERTRDINLEVGIGSKAGTLNYYFISETSAMNSFSKQTLIDNGMLDKVTKIIERPIVTLSSVIKEHLAINTSIDFLNIDTEGFEMEVLSSLDWEIQRPKIIAIEQNHVNTFTDVLQSETCMFLAGKKYQPIGKNLITKGVSTVFYIDATIVSI